MPKFFIEQIAIAPPDPEGAIRLLQALGLKEWVHDIVVARGVVHPTGRDAEPQTNVARLAFNYEGSRGFSGYQGDVNKPIELEVLKYDAGDNWVDHYPGPAVSHLGMHCTESELREFRDIFTRHNIGVAQEVNTVSHNNPVIAGKRWYTYVIFNTRPVLGVDLKFIVRRERPSTFIQPD